MTKQVNREGAESRCACSKVLQLLRSLWMKRRGMRESVVTDQRSHRSERASPPDQETTSQEAQVIELPMNEKSRSQSHKVSRLLRPWHGLSLTPKEKLRRNVAMGSIVFTTVLGLAYALGAVNALSAFMGSRTIAQTPTHVSVSTTASAFTITTDEPSTQALEDDTEVELSAHAALDVDYSSGQRVVRLRAGGATFDVAKDSRRPFIVLADGLRATVLGTKFRVTLTPTVRVEVYEGEVAVSEGPAKAGAMTRKLKAGEVYERPSSPKSRIGTEPVEDRKKSPLL